MLPHSTFTNRRVNSICVERGDNEVLKDLPVFDGGVTQTVKNWQIFSLKWGGECVLPECIAKKLLDLARRKIPRAIVPRCTQLEASVIPIL